MPHSKTSTGFTLIEMLLVLVILVILGAIAVPLFQGIAEKSYQRSARIQVNAVETAIDNFYFALKRYPENLEELRVEPGDLQEAKQWDGPYMKQILADPWGNDYQYQFRGAHNSDSYDFWSYGPNGVNGDDDDIGNW